MADVAIIGLGPIGLGLAKATRHGFAGVEITGFDPDKVRTQRARDSGIFDAVSMRLSATIAGASLIILDTPLAQTKQALEAIGEWAPPSSVITDTGTLKRPVMDWAVEALPSNVGFVGGHALMSHPPSDGIATINGATYCIVADADTPREAIEVVVALARAAGARPFFIDAEEHDSFVIATEYLSKISNGATVDAALHSPVWRDIQDLRLNSLCEPEGNAQDHSLADLSDLSAASLDTVLYWIDRLQEELTSLRSNVASAVSMGEPVDFESVQARRIELLMQRSPSSGIHVERSSVRELILGDWLSHRSQSRRGP